MKKNKKLIVFLVLLVLVLAAYFGQVFYMKKTHESLFESVLEGNEIVRLENVSFEKGFFSSNAEFDAYFTIPPHYYLPEVSRVISQTPVHIKLKFKNNIFAHDNLTLSVDNPFMQILQNLGETYGMNVELDKTFLSATAGVSIFGKAYFEAKFGNVDLKDHQSDVKLVNLGFGAKFDLDSSKILDLSLSFDELNIIDNAPLSLMNFGAKGLKYEENYKNGVTIDEFMSGIYNANSSLNVEKLQYFNLDIDQITAHSSQSVKGNDENATISGLAGLKIAKIYSDSYRVDIKDFVAEGEFSDLSVRSMRIFEDYINSYNTKNAPNPDEIALSFVMTNPKIALKNLEFTSNNKKFSANGDFSGSKEQMLSSFNATSEALPSTLVPLLAIFEIDKAFVEKDGKYTLEIKYKSDFNETKMTINGDSIDLLSVNTFDLDSEAEMPFFDDEAAPVVTPSLPR